MAVPDPEGYSLRYGDGPVKIVKNENRPPADSVRRWAVEQIMAHGHLCEAEEVVKEAKILEAYVLHAEKAGPPAGFDPETDDPRKAQMRGEIT